MYKTQKGFSLVELMIVVSIISILAVMAIPSYQHYTMRARFTEVIAATLPFKTAIAIALQTGAAKSELENGAHFIPPEPPSSKNLANLHVKKGIIIATSSALMNHATYSLTPNEDGSQWEVGGSCLNMGLCRG